MKDDSLFKHNLIFFLKKDDTKLAEAEKILDKKINESVLKKHRIYLDQALKLASLVNLSLTDLTTKDFRLLESLNAKDIKMLLLDIDGVMTDGGMYYTEQGDEFKKFNTKDGIVIRKLTKSGFPVGIISSGFNKRLIQRRAELLGIQKVAVGTRPKTEILEEWCAELEIPPHQVAYIGDDINDFEMMQTVGFSACPADAIDKIKNEAKVVLNRNGGAGCVREFVENYLSRLLYP